MNTLLNLVANESVVWGSTRWTVRTIDDESVILKNMTTKTLKEFPLKLISDAVNDGSIKKTISASALKESLLTPSQQMEADMLTELCEELDMMESPFGRTGESDKLRYYNGQIKAREVLDKHGYKTRKTFSKASLGRIREHYRSNGGDLTFFVRKTRKKGLKQRPKEVLTYINWWIEKVYLTKNKPTVSSVYEQMILRAPVEIRGQIPSQSTVRRMIDKLEMGEVILKRQGKAAYKEYMRATSKKIKADHIMERVEMDAMHLILGVVDDDGRFLGYVTIYFAIDFKSRAVVGWHIEVKQKLRGERTSGVINCFKNTLDASMPVGVKNQFGIGGLIDCVHLDHGTAYTNKEVRKLCKALNISIRFTGTKNGWGKPVAEAFVKFLRNRFGRDIKGYRHKDDVRLGDTEHAKHENCVNINEFKKAVEYFIHFEYHQKRHEGLKFEKPAEIWDKLYTKCPPSLPDDLDRHLFMRELTSRKLHGVRGITLDKQTFQSKTLKNVFCELDTFKNKGESIPVDVRFNEDDASEIVVVHPDTGECILVPNIDRTSFGKSFIEANAQVRDNKQKEKKEQQAGASNSQPKATDQLSSNPVKKRKKNRTNDSVPLDDGQSPFTIEDVWKLMETNEQASSESDDDDMPIFDDSEEYDWGYEDDL